MISGPSSYALACGDLDVTIAGRTLVQALALRLAGGSCTALLGRNGAGKTTTLHTLAGLHVKGRGTLALNDKPLPELGRKQLARRLGLLMQNYEYPFPSTVLSAVLIGRHPHLGLLQWESRDDQALARQALAAVGLEGFEERDVTTLSGGERRRLSIATLLAQDPDVYLLDEPVNNLDPRYQLMIMRLLADKARAGHAVMVSLHDVNLARVFCQRAVLLFGDGTWLAGPAHEVINADNLSRLYTTPFASVEANGQHYYYAA